MHSATPRESSVPPPSPPPSESADGSDSPSQFPPRRLASPPPVHPPRSGRSSALRSPRQQPPLAKMSAASATTPPAASTRNAHEPIHVDDYDAYDHDHHVDEEHSFGGLHWLPLVFVVVPGIGAIVHGDAKGWTDGLVGLVAGLFLWQLAKVPWKMYASSRTARIAFDATRGSGVSQSAIDTHSTELLTYEVFSLFLSFVCPVFGILLLGWSTDAFTTPTSKSLFNRTSIVLYALASAVKPLTTAVDLIMQRTQYLQSTATLVEPLAHRSMSKLKHDIETIRQDLSVLQSSAATTSALDQLRVELDMPLGRLSRAVRRSARNEQGMRNETDDRFAAIQDVVEELGKRVEEEEDRVKALEEENWALRVTPVAAAGTLLINWLGWPTTFFRPNSRAVEGGSTSDRAQLPMSDSSSSLASNSSSSLGTAYPSALVFTSSLGRMIGSLGPGSNCSPSPHGVADTKKWTERLPWNLVLLPVNAVALTAAYVGAVVVGKDLIPHPPPSLYSMSSGVPGSPIDAKVKPLVSLKGKSKTGR